MSLVSEVDLGREGHDLVGHPVDLEVEVLAISLEELVGGVNV